MIIHTGNSVERLDKSHGPITPTELMTILGGKCPYCGRKLGKPTMKDITVKVPEQVVQTMELLGEFMKNLVQVGGRSAAYTQV